MYEDITHWLQGGCWLAGAPDPDWLLVAGSCPDTVPALGPLYLPFTETFSAGPVLFLITAYHLFWNQRYRDNAGTSWCLNSIYHFLHCFTSQYYVGKTVPLHCYPEWCERVWALSCAVLCLSTPLLSGGHYQNSIRSPQPSRAQPSPAQSITLPTKLLSLTNTGHSVHSVQTPYTLYCPTHQHPATSTKLNQ